MTGSLTAALRPAEAQQVFRAVLEALARPGTPTALPAGVLESVAGAVLPVLALADLGTGICILEDAQCRWGDLVSTATGAPLWPAELARLVAAVRPVTDAEVRDFARGTASVPGSAALVSLAVADVVGGHRRWRMSGPGIDGATTISPVGLPPGFVAARNDAVADYPAGIDVLLATRDGRLVGVPRTTAITEES